VKLETVFHRLAIDVRVRPSSLSMSVIN
jgi:hypothetical protein